MKYTIDFRPGGRSPASEYAKYMEDAGVALGGLRIIDNGDGTVTLDDEAVAALRRQPEDADGCIDEDQQCWIEGDPYPVEQEAS